MSSFFDNSTESGHSLFDPPDQRAEGSDPSDSDETVTVQVELSAEQAEALYDLASHLSLPPSMVAARAIEMTCEDVNTVSQSKLTTDTVVEEYQARLDLLHSLEQGWGLGSGA